MQAHGACIVHPGGGHPPATGNQAVHVLIADDDPLVVQLLTAAFRKEGWRTSMARDAMQSMMFAMRAPQPDAILLDLSMPGGAGLDVLRKLKLSVKTAEIPVVIVSGDADPELPARAAELGAVEFVQKPIDAEALVARLKELVGAD